jgi:hypothetical protein
MAERLAAFLFGCALGAADDFSFDILKVKMRRREVAGDNVRNARTVVSQEH